MRTNVLHAATRKERSLDQMLASQALSRVTGATAVPGNGLRLLRNGAENYPAWMEAIGSARDWIQFENYIIYDDATGRTFVDLLAERARAGVRIYFLYDWLGCFRKLSRPMLRTLTQAGVQVRIFNPPRLDSPLGWLSRNHRKTLTVDGRIGFVSGLCVGDAWAGDPTGRRKPWRDTGVAIEGPVLGDLESAFRHSWNAAGPALERLEAREPRGIPPSAGDVSIRLIEGQPSEMGVYRLDLLIAAGVQDRLWLTDAYFVGTTAYIQALGEAARDGVDVRLLVPGISDIPITQALSRASYRPLLEAGVRIFEWNGPMLHAKTAVADGHWARVGSTNLNIASWIGNWELDLAIEDGGFAEAMETMYLEDLAQSTEVVLDVKHRPKAITPRSPSGHRQKKPSTARVAAGSLGIGNTVGAALTNRRAVGRAEAGVLAGAGAILLVVAVLAAFFPRLVAVPIMLAALLVGGGLLMRAWKLRHPAKVRPPDPV
ncbi:phospholipase D-like domain-containing protein [Skermanella mucosa]|uniref:phospholipase D-like domain-containing protein n=1 Tax=Skermanella mucosa TaxID=1789672 RepID=UPI00192CAE7E|nr:phospholipase D-like domain-containing protein [Skermanella mucosa]UEM19864.1 phospholipase D-like domain-containing protein [Skermanella mucosa]